MEFMHCINIQRMQDYIPDRLYFWFDAAINGRQRKGCWKDQIG